MKTPVQQPPIPELSSFSPHLDEGKISDQSSSRQREPSASALPVDGDPPDGGYGWVVVSACSLITYGLVPHFKLYSIVLLNPRAFYVGGFYSWGVLQAGLANEKVAPDSTLAFVGSLAVAWVAMGAVPNSWVIHWLGARSAAILGCFLLGLGQVLNSFSAKNVLGLFFTNGIVVGLGNSLCFFVRISSYPILRNIRSSLAGLWNASVTMVQAKTRPRKWLGLCGWWSRWLHPKHRHAAPH